MPRTLLTVIALVAACAVTAIVGQVLDFNGVAYFGAMLLGMLLVSLTDRERFWGIGPGERR